MLFIVDKALKSDEISSTSGEKADMYRYKVIDDFIAGVKDAKEKEFVAYVAPRLLGDSTAESEMLKVIEFIKTKLVGECEVPVKIVKSDNTP